MNGKKKLKNFRKIMEDIKYDVYIISYGEQNIVKLNK